MQLWTVAPGGPLVDDPEQRFVVIDGIGVLHLRSLAGRVLREISVRRTGLPSADGVRFYEYLRTAKTSVVNGTTWRCWSDGTEE